MDFPIIIYDIDKQIIPKTSIAKKNCFYFYSYQLFDARIISGSGILFSVKENNINNNTVLTTEEGQFLQGNFGYTLFIPDNYSTLTLELTSDSTLVNYSIQLNLDNIINEENGNLHYNDLLINNKLPNYNELILSIPDEFDKSELIKRLLIDFKDIIRKKGTIRSIEKFFDFIGYAEKNTIVKDEYFNLETNNYTVSPNKLKDIKTGYYHILYNNYTENGLTINNLPDRLTTIENLEAFKISLFHAISLANTYFTAEEQLIRFFGLSYSSNVLFYSGITSNCSMCFENDVNYFRKNLHINLKSYTDSQHSIDLIYNCLLKKNTLYKSEIKTYSTLTKDNNNLYLIDDEIFDDEIFDNINISNYERVFGVCVHLNVISPNTYMEIELFETSQPSNKISIPKHYVVTNLEKIIVLTKTTEYTLEVKVWDNYNNFEKYFYNLKISSDIQKIDFDIFNSLEFTTLKGLTQEIDSESEITNILSQNYGNFILSVNDIPTDLLTYFQQITANRWLSENSRYQLKNVNNNFVVNTITNTIPINIIEPYLNILCLPYLPYASNYQLKLRIFDYNICEYIIINFNELKNYHILVDKLYVTLMDIIDIETNETIPYIFITTTETGIDFNINLYDIVLVPNDLNPANIISIYDLTTLINTNIPINHDIPLFNITSTLYPLFNTYISNTELVYKDTINTESGLIEYVTIKSLFTHLININEITQDTYYLKLGDVVVCKLNDNEVVNFKNILWSVYNSFTKKIIFETTDLTLKLRIEDNTCYDVKCKFYIDNIEHSIYKVSIISSFMPTITI